MQGSARIDELRQKFHENPRRYFAPLANEYRKAGDPEQAIAICRAHLAQQPAHMSGHVVYAQALYDGGRTDESRVVFEKALTLDPDNAIVLRYLGDISRQKGDTVEARHWYTRALEADPHSREIAAYLAELTEPLTEAEPAALVHADAASQATVPETEPVTDESGVAPAEKETEPSAMNLAEPEPEPAAEPEAEAEAEAEADVDVDVTPVHISSGSPFVTRTMADLYARQGYHEQALEVYRQLADANPEDADIAGRIRELTPAEQPPAPDGVSDTLPANEFAEPHDSLPDAGSMASEEDSGEALTPVESTESAAHFTETDLGPGDEWDTDAWAAGFSSEEPEVVPFDFVASNDFAEAAIFSEVAESETPAASALPETETEIEYAGDVATALPPGVLNETREDVSDVEFFSTAQESMPPVAEPQTESPVSEPEPEETAAEPEVEHFVAYAPELPDEEHLPHYAPPGPTIREFFATLGAYRPPENGGMASFTARAALPEIDATEKAEPADEFPLVSDALANLFPDSPVTEEDSRAAFALSGALSGQPSRQVTRARSTPPASVPAVTAPILDVPPAARESEEDIRKFREWLDGLADS